MLIVQLLQSPEDWSHITELVHEPGLRLQALCARSSVARIGTGDRPRARRMGRFWRHDLLAMQSQSRELGTQRACVHCCKPSTQRAMHARHAHHALMQGVTFFAHTMEVYNGYDVHNREQHACMQHKHTACTLPVHGMRLLMHADCAVTAKS